MILAKLGFAVPARPVGLVKLHEAHRPMDCFLLRLHIEERKAADHLLRLAEGSVGDGQLAARQRDARSRRTRQQAAHLDEHTGLARFFPELPYGLHQCLRGRARPEGLGRFHDRHESHCRRSLGFGSGASDHHRPSLHRNDERRALQSTPAGNYSSGRLRPGAAISASRSGRAGAPPPLEAPA